MITSYNRGHKIYFDGEIWKYHDNNKVTNYERSCKRCGKEPTKEGYDNCLGFIEGSSSACCGHGVEELIMIKDTE